MANIAAVNSKLTDLDPMLREFCSRHGFLLGGGTELFPRRRLWQRREIDRCLDLAPDCTVSELMATGFGPDMTWSLEATASLLPNVQPTRLLKATVFANLRYSELPLILAAQLEAGFRLLRDVSLNDVLDKGQPCS